MIKYNLFELYVVFIDGINYICKKTKEGYKDIFTSKVFKEENIECIEDLSYYYEILVMKSYINNEPVYLGKDELLIKFARLNYFNLYKEKQDNFVENVINDRKEYLEVFKELSIKNPEKAKEIARVNLQRSGILDKNKELKEPYNEVFIKNKTL